ncbi:MAG: hypothetical protein JXL20_12415, partial [Deltaproteobacteria bacterium]|nr:hypothetical protein [Deltaproteobacteria bacterium]
VGMRISKYAAAESVNDADQTVIVQGGVTKKALMSVLKAYFGSSETSLPDCTAESDFVVAAGSPLAWAKKTLADVKALLHAAPGAIGETTPSTIRGLNKEVFKTASGSLTALECAGTIINNYGMTDADCDLTLPAASEGLAFTAILSAVRAHYVRFNAQESPGDKIYLLGEAGDDGGYVGVASGYASGDAISFFTFKASDGGYDWFAIPLSGTWVAG